MTDQQLIETIVSKVVARLRAGSGRTDRMDDDVQSLPERVVTEASLSRLDTRTNRLVFAADAVVTPAARDYLRRRQISWSRAVGGSGDAEAKALLIVQQAAPVIAAVRQSLIQSAVPWTIDDPACRQTAIQRATDAVRRQFQVAVFTDVPEETACLLNRDVAVRAAGIADDRRLEAIQSQFRPNVICLTTTGLSFVQLRNLLFRFGQTVPNGLQTTGSDHANR